MFLGTLDTILPKMKIFLPSLKLKSVPNEKNPGQTSGYCHHIQDKESATALTVVGRAKNYTESNQKRSKELI